MIRFYLTPFNDQGEFGEEIEITKFVDFQSLGKLKRSLSNSTYDIGILRYNNLTLKLHNDQGEFSEIDNLRSVFRFRRSGSKVRITWAPAEPAICGIAICGETILSEEVTIFEGLLNDESASMSIDDQIMDFVILSYDSQFSKVIVPFEDLVAGVDKLSDILFKILDQTEITKYVDVSAESIDLQVDFVPDDLSWFENKTGLEAIEAILLVANSVIYVEDGTIKARSRAPSADIKFHFFGQASDLGNENVNMIGDFRNGQNRIVNFVRWKDGEAVRSAASIERWGVSIKEIDSDFVADSSKQILSAQSIANEFRDPKREMSVETNIDVESIGLKFLDRVDMDYPSVVEPAGKYLPIVGLTKIGDVESPLPHLLWDFRINQDINFKIMGPEYDLKKETINFALREI